MKTHGPAFIKELTIIVSLAALLAAGCATSNLDDIHHKSGFKIKTLRKYWEPVAGGIERKDVPYEHVEFLEKEPTDRKFQIIGYCAPNWQAGHQYIKAARGEAALHGADACYFVDRTQNPTMPRHTAAVIVWK